MSGQLVAKAIESTFVHSPEVTMNELPGGRGEEAYLVSRGGLRLLVCCH